MKRAGGALLPTFELEPASPVPLYAQVYRRIRESILGGSLTTGARLPSTRTLAADLGASRSTVEAAFAQLVAEGFLERRVGAGTFVAPDLRSDLQRPRAPIRGREPSAPRALSSRGALCPPPLLAPFPTTVRPFTPGIPALDRFPFDVWHRLLSRRSRTSGRELLAYGDPGGYRPLREAVAGYLGTSRGVLCDWRQVVILTCSQQGLELAARLLLDPGQEAWIEEPGYLGARAALQWAGARLVSVPVDDEGLDVEQGLAAAPRARLAVVTPSHQYPSGVTMSLARRLALLAWAARSGSWIVEDDYAGEYRFNGRPIAALQGIDRSGRVVYLGTFSKVMFPSLRLGYLVAPEDLVDAFIAARTLCDGHPHLLAQAVLADFIGEGHFTAHLRHMRALYQQRRDVFFASASEHLGRFGQLGPSDAGMHVLLRLPSGLDDRVVSTRAAAEGLDVPPLSRYYLGEQKRRGLVLGFAGLSPLRIRPGVKALARCLERGKAGVSERR